LSKKALITGITGQDGSYLAEFLIKRELGWSPSVTFEQGLSKTIDWFLKNKEWLQNVTSGNYQEYYKKHYNQ